MNTQVATTLASTVSPTPATKEEINALHDEFRRCGKNAREWMRQCQMMLPRIRDEEVWRKKGYNSIYDYARILAGMSKNSVDDALWIMDKIANKPELQEIAREKGLSAVRPVVAIATEETSQFWAEKASDMSQNTLKTYVRNSRENSLTDSRVNPSQRVPSQNGSMSNGEFCLGDSGDCEVSEEGSDTAGDKKTASVYMKLEVEVIEKLKQIKGDRDWNELMKDLLEGKVSNAEKIDKVKSEKPAPVNTGKRYVPKKIKKYVTKKTSGFCAYPGCSKPYKILHHTKRFAIDSTHDPDSLAPLCKAHERLAHKGLIENESAQPVEFMSGAGGRSGEGQGGGQAEIKVNWSLRTDPDVNNPKYKVDKKVNEYYAPKLE